MNPPDLTKQPPRSARCRLGGYALLPRALDKCRAELAGKNGEYHFNCPLDQHFMRFAGIEEDQLRREVATGKGDGEILEWVKVNSSTQPSDAQIAQWSAWRDAAVPTDPDGRDYFNGIHKAVGPNRSDIATWADVLDLDDYVSFGGKA